MRASPTYFAGDTIRASFTATIGVTDVDGDAFTAVAIDPSGTTHTASVDPQGSGTYIVSFPTTAATGIWRLRATVQKADVIRTAEVKYAVG